MTRKKLLRLLKKYDNDPGVAKVLGVTRQAVYQLRKKYAIPSSRYGNDERNASICEMYSRGVSVPEIRKQTHLSIPHIYRILQNSTRTTS